MVHKTARMEMRTRALLLVVGPLAALAGACNALSGIGDFRVEPTSDDASGVGQESGPVDGTANAFDGAAGEAEAPESASDREVAASDALTDTPTDAPTLDSGIEAPVADAGAPDGAGDVDSAAAGDAGDATTSTVPDAAADADAARPDGGCAVASPLCDGGCPTAHSDGLGQTFYDCAPWGTMNETQALEACTAYTGSTTACANDPIGCANADEVCTTGASACVCWTYTGMHKGSVFASTTATCSCYVASAPSWN